MSPKNIFKENKMKSLFKHELQKKQVLHFLRSYGLDVQEISFNDPVKKCPVQCDEPDKQSGLYFFNGKYGYLYNFLTGTGKVEWFYDPHQDQNLSPAEKDEVIKICIEAKNSYDFIIDYDRCEAEKKCIHVWNHYCIEVDEHPALTKNGISKPYGVKLNTRSDLNFGGQECYQNLVLSIYNKGSELCSLCFINANNEIRYFNNTDIEGAFSYLGNPSHSHTIYICEDYITACKVHEKTGAGVVIYLEKYNALSITQFIKDLYPESKLILVHKPPTNLDSLYGLQKCINAGIATQIPVIIHTVGDSCHE